MAVAAAFTLGALAWIVDQGVGYPLVKVVCANGQTHMLTVISAAALAMAVAGGLLGIRARHVDRYRFVATVAAGFNLLIGLLVMTAAVAPFVLSPCE